MAFPFATGFPIIICPRFEPVSCFSYIEKYKITLMLAVPPILIIMARHPGKQASLLLESHSQHCQSIRASA